MNWEKLKEAIDNGEYKFSTVTAVMPRHPPAMVMRACCDGIYPDRTGIVLLSGKPKSKYYERVKK